MIFSVLTKENNCMNKIKLIILTVLFVYTSVNAQYIDEPIERRLGFGAEFGTIGSIGGPYFGMAFSGDYMLGRNFSLAEIVSFIPSGDLTQVNANTVARFNIPLKSISIIPYMGIGFSYGSYSTELANENSISFAFPIGVAVTYPVALQIDVVGRVQFALVNLDYGILGKDENYAEFMAGFRFIP
jgi:hypothetical protein